jgi:hypothetical protein
MNTSTTAATHTLANDIDHMITITCGGMTAVCKTPDDWALREKNMREFAAMLLDHIKENPQP